MQSVRIIGNIKESFKFFRKSFEENLYSTNIHIKRKSDVEDVLKVVVPEVLKQRLSNDITDGKTVTVELVGEFRSKNIHIGDVSKVVLYLYATEINIVDPSTPHENRMEFDGFVVKSPVFRSTPRGKQITDLCIAINRVNNNSSDYIPTLVWGKCAILANKLEIGSHIKGVGRVQSRGYVKKYDDGTVVEKTAYEMSILSFSFCEDKEGVADGIDSEE